jgi:hypothetical protein
MAYLTETYLQNLFGSDEVAALCPTAGELAAVISAASAETETALQNGGYSAAVPSTVYESDLSDCPGAISLLAFGAWLELAHGRKRVEIPAQFLEYVRKLDLVRTGRMEIPGVDKDTTRTVGGVSFSSSDDDVEAGGRPHIFSRSNMAGF